MCLRRFLFNFIFPSFLLLSNACVAQLKDLSINANNLSFEKDKNKIEAAGSVEAVYKNFVLNGNHLIYDTSTEALTADKGFIFHYQGITLEGEKIYYHIPRQEGEAKQFDLLYRGIKIAGSRVSFDRNQFNLKNASFTTCDTQNPHYRVTASEILFYPTYNWLVAYWGLFWLGNLPIVPMPSYIYDLNAQEKEDKNLPPFPQIGSNAIDGNYINESLAWHLRRELSGTYSMSYAANKGLGGGIEANYIVNEQNKGNFRINGNAADGFSGGITNILNLGNEIIPPETATYQFFALPRHFEYELKSILSSRERINYQKVTFLPGINFSTHDRQIADSPLKYELDLFVNNVAEEGNLHLLNGGGRFKFYGETPINGVNLFSPSVLLDSIFYSNGQKWLKPSIGFAAVKKFTDDLALDCSYQHYLMIDGSSPFNYEMYRFRAADRLSSDLLFKIGETKGKIYASYFLDNWSPEDIDYSLFFKLHCYGLELTYRSMRNEFLIGFSLEERG